MTVSPTRVLVVEDDDVNAFVVEEMLLALGYDPEVARDGHQAVDKACGERFGIILMDIEMPRMDGLAATEAIRKAEAGAGHAACPVVGMSGHKTAGVRRLCELAGMTGYLTKPFTLDMLLQALEDARNDAGTGGDHRAGADTAADDR